MEDYYQIFAILVIIAIIIIFIYRPDMSTYTNLTRAYDDRPTIWIYVDDTDVNSRFWSDFGARSSRALNIPFLNLCYSTIVKAAGSNYRVEMISGVDDVIEKLGGAEHVPDEFIKRKRMLNEVDKAYMRVAMLERYGGLWLPINTVCLRTIPQLPADSVAFFGTDQSNIYATGSMPGSSILWSPKADNPIITQWANMLMKRVEDRNGGIVGLQQDMDYLLREYKGKGVTIMDGLCLDKKPNGKTVGIEDWMAHGLEGELPFMITEKSVFFPVDYAELTRRRVYGWFLKMSEDQIWESDLVIKHLLKVI
jgi:hypothetical protein